MRLASCVSCECLSRIRLPLSLFLQIRTGARGGSLASPAVRGNAANRLAGPATVRGMLRQPASAWLPEAALAADWPGVDGLPGR